MLLADDLDQLLEILPQSIVRNIKVHPNKEQLVEIVLDIGRRPEARFAKKSSYLSYKTIVWQDIEYILKRLGKFNEDNRAGIERTLHRISSLRNRQGSVIGLTCRIGRAFFGAISIVRDLLETNKSILLLGKPGVGKTTAIREIARVLSDGMNKRVIIIDTSNEIAGDGDLPHPSIGKARRMQVPSSQNQHQIMIEAVENHMPEIIIIDEIGTELEANAARTIAERGVQLVGTAHGNALENLIKNPTITDLIGGIQYVTLGDEEAKRRGSSKSILERKASPTFEIAIELHDAKSWVIHESIEQSIDLLLQGQILNLQERKLYSALPNTSIKCDLMVKKKDQPQIFDKNLVKIDAPYLSSTFTKNSLNGNKLQRVKKSDRSNLKLKRKLGHKILYIYGVNMNDLKSLIRALKLPIILTKEVQAADAILALTALLKSNKRLRQIAYAKKLPIYTTQSNSFLHIAKVLQNLAKIDKATPTLPLNKILATREEKRKFSKIMVEKLLTPLEETRLVIEEVIIPKKQVVDLLPRSSSIRKLQHELVIHYQLVGVSVGSEPNRRLRIYPK